MLTMKDTIVSLQDFPSLKVAFDNLMAEKAVLQKKVAPLRKRYDELQTAVTPYEVEMRSLIEKIHDIERPRLVDIEAELSAIARAAGGTVMRAVAE